MSTASIVTAVQAKAAAVSGIRAAYDRTPDTLAPGSVAVVGNHRGNLAPGTSWEKYVYTFPLRVYVPMEPDEARVRSTVNDFLDAFIVQFRSGVGLSGNVTQSLIRGWDATGYDVVGGTQYAVLEMSLEVTVAGGHTYSA